MIIKYSAFYVFALIVLKNFLGADVTTTVVSAFVSPCPHVPSFTKTLSVALPPSPSCYCHDKSQETNTLYCNINDMDDHEHSQQHPRQQQSKGEHHETQQKMTSAGLFQSQHQQKQQRRRKFLQSTASGTGALFFPYSSSLVTSSASSLPTSQVDQSKGDVDTRPICIIGANGKTGSECVGACLDRGIPVVATTRGGVYTGNYANAAGLVVDNAICDVTLPDTIQAAIKGSRAVIFAASASKAGGPPAAVDNLGLVNVARSCIDHQIPHLVIVSSGLVTKPESPVYKFLNLFGNIMEEKIKGEDSVRRMYQQYQHASFNSVGVASGSTYTIIRPGGLTEESAKGVQALELNQGDTKSGRISRADVASLCIEATKYPAITGGTTFECYDADTGKPLQTVGISNLFKQRNNSKKEASGRDGGVYMSGYEQRGSTWGELFTGLIKDGDVQYRQVSAVL